MSLQMVWVPLDLGEEGYARPMEVAFVSRSDAETVASRVNQGHEKAVRQMPLFNAVIEYEGWSRNLVRQRALSKLSAEEKEALGL